MSNDLIGTTCTACDSEIDSSGWAVKRLTTCGNIVTVCEDCDDHLPEGKINDDALEELPEPDLDEYPLPEPDELERVPADEFECPCGCTDDRDGGDDQ